MHWDDALRTVSEKAAYMSPAERLSTLVPLDPRVRAGKAVAELGAPYLDRGLAKWEAPNRVEGFLWFFAWLEGGTGAPWRAHARQEAKRILEWRVANPDKDMEELALQIIEENLSFMEDDVSKWISTARAMLMDLPGWAGMFKRMEEHMVEGPQTCAGGMCVPVLVRLVEFMAVHSIVQRSSLAALAQKEGWDPDAQSLTKFLSRVPATRRGERPKFGMGAEMNSLQNPSGLATNNQNFDMMNELEDEYARITVRAINSGPALAGKDYYKPRTNLQFYTCFDEREESFRRYLEAASEGPFDIETFGVAGFFNMAIRYKTADFRPEEVLAPEGNCPSSRHLIELKELTPGHLERKVLLSELSLAYEKTSMSPVGALAISLGMMPISMSRLVIKSFSPSLTMELEDKFTKLVVPDSVTDFAMPYTVKEASDRIAQLFKNVGEMNNFARLVVLTGHGARQVNNPFLAAYNCGACCGREGGPNARIFARCANDHDVRALLLEEHLIDIPSDTWFVGGYHDTTTDLVDLYDLDRVPASHARDLDRARTILDQARAKNAMERCSKFLLANPKTPAEALKHVETRGRDVAEVRPELCHSTNGAIILGRRELTKGRNLDRRAFLPNYDPFNDDDEGTNLQTVLTPALVVGSGINLEYFFSTTDGGAGTKVPVNVVGNFALQQGTAGDLLIGLATQMSELHSPLRAFYLIDSPIERVEKVLNRVPLLKKLVRNKWVKFHVRDPVTQTIFEEDNGMYYPIDDPVATNEPLPDVVPFDEHLNKIEGVKKTEDIFTAVASAIVIGSSFLPLYQAGWNPAMVDAQQATITVCATLFTASALAFSRRYLHGEFMYGRMQIDSSLMLLGFNIVVSAPSLEDVAIGWTLIGYASTFLIGGFNDRPTARDNAAYAFLLYQISDAALLLAIAFGAQVGVGARPELAAAGLITAACIKSSQWPFSGLFMRSMEGASPNSALGYAGISAHAGVVLLVATSPMWQDFEWARLALGTIGGITAFQNGIIANVRNDRKGAIASATSATLGTIYVVLACGFDDLALLLALGHGAFRMNQVLRSPSSIQDSNDWAAVLGKEKSQPTKVFDILWRLGWSMNRVNSDFFRLPDIYTQVDLKRPLAFYNSKVTQSIISTSFLVAIAAFHLPAVDDYVAELMKTEPLLAAVVLAVNIFGSTALIRFLFGNVLDFGRFMS